MNSLSTIITDTNPIELWRLIRQEWYYIEDEEILLLPDCLDLRKDMQPPETCISFNECKGENYYEKIFQLMEDLFFKLNIKEDYLFAGLIDEEIYKSINKREKLIEFKRDRGEENSHFGLYYLTNDDTKILTIKSKLINFLEKKLTNIIHEDEILKSELNKLKKSGTLLEAMILPFLRSSEFTGLSRFFVFVFFSPLNSDACNLSQQPSGGS